MGVSTGQGAGVGVQGAARLDYSLFFPYPTGTCDRFLVFVVATCDLPEYVTLGSNAAGIVALSGLTSPKLTSSIWIVAGQPLPTFLPLSITLPDIADVVAFVLPLFGVTSGVAHSELEIGTGTEVKARIHGATDPEALVFMNLGLPGQIIDIIPPGQTYIQSLGAYNGGPVRAFHYVTSMPTEPGGPTFLGALSQSTPWCAALAEIR